MNATYPHVTVSGLKVSQQFVPVQSGTGVLASSASIRVTGTQAHATVMELREPPVGSSISPDSDNQTGKVAHQ